jgi:DNA-binding transcriptional ArsR family regulator
MRLLPDLAAIGGRLGDQCRAVMLAELQDGRALTATELAACAGVAPPTASEHLARLASPICSAWNNTHSSTSLW